MISQEDIREAREVLKYYHANACENHFVQHYQGFAIALEALDKVERIAVDKVIKAMDSIEDYVDDGGSGRPLCLGEILSGKNIDKIAQVIVSMMKEGSNEKG